MVLLFGAQVVDFDHIGMMQAQKLDDVLLAVSVQALESLSWESARDDPVRDVGQVEIKATLLESGLVGRDDASHPVSGAAASAGAFASLFV